jgi:hypothetical protein
MTNVEKPRFRMMAGDFYIKDKFNVKNNIYHMIPTMLLII